MGGSLLPFLSDRPAALSKIARNAPKIDFKPLFLFGSIEHTKTQTRQKWHNFELVEDIKIQQALKKPLFGACFIRLCLVLFRQFQEHKN